MASNLYFSLLVDDTQTTTTSFAFVFDRTVSSFTSVGVSYFAFNDFTYIALQYIDVTVSSVSSITGSVQTYSESVTYTTKSNTNHAVVLVFTVGGTFGWINGAFGYSLAISNLATSGCNLDVTVAANSSMSSLRVGIIDYEDVVIQVLPPYYISQLSSTSSSGTVLENSSIAITDNSEILNGLTYVSFTDGSALSISLGFSANSFTVSTFTATAYRYDFLWYKKETCGNNYYIDPNNAAACLSCDVTCLTCSGSSNTTCTSCTSTRTLTTGSCPCNTGLYEALVADCPACSANCPTCKGTADNCTTCRSSDNRIASYSSTTDKTTCVCKTGFYDTGSSQTCAACASTCLTCLGAAATCQSCRSTDNRALNQSGSTCDCITKYYSTGAVVCSACPYSCATCTSASNCATCNPAAHRTQAVAGTGLCTCAAGYYDNLASETCIACYYKCTTCSSSSVCDTCDATRTKNSTGMCVCNVGYYDDGINAACPACDYTCKTCTAANSCAQCDAANYRTFDLAQAATCVCFAKYYSQGSPLPLCQPCDVTCANCTAGSNGDCTNCNASAHRILSVASGTGACNCMDGYFDNGVELCSACNYKCLTCTSSTACVTCDSTKFRQQSLPNCPCMSGYFDNSTATCAACPYYCTTCSSATVCTSCDATRTSSTTCPCKTGYYNDGVNRVCPACMITCVTCNNASTCLTCNSTNLRTLTLQGQCDCKTKAFEANPVVAACTACAYSCATCITTSTNCVTCNGTAKRAFSSGTCPCSAGYYDNGST